MAITRTMRPRVLISGTVVTVADKKRKADGSIYGKEIVLKQSHDSFPSVSFFEKNYGVVPKVGDFFAAEVEIEESREYGSQLTYSEQPFGALDAIHSALSAK